MAAKLYELFVILPASVGANAKPTLESLIQKCGGKVITFSDLGKRTLGYQVKKQKEASCLNLELELEPKQVELLAKSLRLNEEILRFMLTVKTSRFKIRPPKRVRKKKVPVVGKRS